MRLKQVEIGGFGKWKNKVISFDQHFQVVFGENEAGKSTLYEFIRFVLFDPSSRKANQVDYTPRDHHLFGGRLVYQHPTYGEVKIERFKGHHKGQARVYFADGRIGKQEEVAALLAPLTLEIFDEVFSLKQEELLRIRYLDEAKLQQLLLTVGLSGSQKLLREKDSFSKNHKEMYRPGGRVRPINQELEAFRDLTQQIKLKEQGEQAYRQQKTHLQQLETSLGEHEAHLATAEQEATQLAEQERLWDTYEERKQVVASLALVDNTLLNEQQVKRLEALEQEDLFIRKQIVDYQNKKEEQLVNGQLSPALVFFQNNQREITNIVGQHPKYLKLQARLEWLAEKGHKEEVEVTRLRHLLNVSSGDAFPPLQQGDYQLVQELARRQTSLKEELNQIQTQLPTLAAAEATPPPLSQRLMETPVILSFSALLVVLAGGSFYLGQPLISLIILIVGLLVALGVFWWNQRHSSAIAHEAALETQRDQLSAREGQLNRDLASIEEEKVALSNRLGFPVATSFSDWLYLWPQREQLTLIEAEQLRTTQEIDQLHSEEEVYRRHLGVMSEWIPVQTIPVGEAYQQLLTFVQEMKDKEQHLHEASITNWHEPLQALTERQAALPQELVQIIPHRPEATLRELPVILANQDLVRRQQQQAELLTNQLAKVFDLSQDYSLSEIQAEAQLVSAQQGELTAVRTKLVQDVQQLAYDLKQQESDGTLTELYQARENQAEVLKTQGREWLDYRLGEQVLQDVLNFLGRQHLPRLLATATQYLKELTLGRYQKCEFKEEHLQVVHEDGQVFQLGELSTGTRDQLYIALRLAFIHLHSDEQYAPLMIDDGWLHYDQARKRALFQLLTNFSQQIQVICLSSDVELASFAEEQELAITYL